MRYKISFDTAEKAFDPSLDCGIWHFIVEEDEVVDKVEQLAMIGFTANVEIVTE